MDSFNEILEKEASSIINDQDFTSYNKIVIQSFGDLKNYNYHYRYAFVELEGTFDLLKSNKLSKFTTPKDMAHMGLSILDYVKS